MRPCEHDDPFNMESRRKADRGRRWIMSDLITKTACASKTACTSKTTCILACVDRGTMSGHLFCRRSEDRPHRSNAAGMRSLVPTVPPRGGARRIPTNGESALPEPDAGEGAPARLRMLLRSPLGLGAMFKYSASSKRPKNKARAPSIVRLCLHGTPPCAGVNDFQSTTPQRPAYADEQRHPRQSECNNIDSKRMPWTDAAQNHVGCDVELLWA